MPSNTNSADERISLNRLPGEEVFPNPFKRDVTQVKVIDSRGNHYLISGQDPIDYEGSDYEVLAFPATSDWDQRNTKAIVGGHTIDECIHFLEEWLNGSRNRGWAPTPIQHLQWLFEDEGEEVAFAWMKEKENGEKIVDQLFTNIRAGMQYGIPDLAIGGMLAFAGMLGVDFSDMPDDIRKTVEGMGFEIP